MGELLPWRVLVDPPLPGAVNMARDHALASCLGSDEAVLRLYRWSAPTVSFGRNENTRGVYDRAQAAARGIAFVRRPTGGAAVLHHRELTYAVIAPVAAFGGLRRAYRAINHVLLDALAELGVEGELAAPGGAAQGSLAGPCFQGSAPGEVTVRGRKLLGSAQARVGRTILQHGSLLLDDDQSVLQELGVGGGTGAGSIALSEVLGRAPLWDEVAGAVARGLADGLGGVWTRGELREEERIAASEMLPHYRSLEWTWRL